MSRVLFYLRYAWTNLRNSGHWTTFAVFCVAAGVATVVALRSLGLSITDSLLSNLRQYNHGDISISSVPSFGPFSITFQRGSDEPSVFQPWQVQTVADWVAARGGSMTPYAIVSNVQVTPLGEEESGRPQFTSSFLIDPETFSISNSVVAIDPPGVPLKDLFTGGLDVVISQNMAEAQNINVGDEVRVSGTEQKFTVRGIVPTETEASINNILAAFFGFVYFHRDQAATLGLNTNPNSIGIILPDGTPPDDIAVSAGEVARSVRARDVNATPWLLERNKELSDMIGRFIVTMGLGALLIGGVGIMNTMLVLVGRRTMEIAALKTFGLKGYQVAALFIAEAFFIGIMGSIVGVIGGLLLSGAVNQFGEAFLQQRLPWRLHPEAVLYGAVLGMIVTMVFGVLPVLTATKVRPAIVLRPNEGHIARAGIFQSLIALLSVVLVLGVVSGQILGPVVENVAGDRAPNSILLGILAVAGTMAFLGLLVGVMWVIVWLLGFMPTFGNVDMRLALRNLSTRRLRTAVTLLALTAGMFALSSITYFGLGAREIVRIQFGNTLGGNVMIVPLLPKEVGQPLIDYAMSFQEGVQYKTIVNANFARIVEINGEPIVIEGQQRALPLTMLMRETDNPALNSGPLIAGRDLTPEDRGKNVIVLSQQSVLETLVESYGSLEEIGVTVGSTVRINLGAGTQIFEVVGIVGSSNSFTPNIAGAYLPPDAPGVGQSYVINVIQVDPEHINQFLTNMSALPLVFSMDVAFIDGLLKRLVDQLSAIPTVVGLLSLLAAAVIMANTVSLTILERRRQIGILKALGLKRQRVLRVILLENTVIGLLGGLLGIGVSSLGVSLLTALGTGSAIPIPSDATFITIGLIIASVLIAWVATLLSARVAIGERVSKILRYE
ncbi:MAG: FtsX-like permease family protein [Anaerolineae bacterium]|nr:FtsX-like permease family protein [Anaerolineae bacterium]